MDNRPIGIFDSGLGGLTVVKEIIKLLPNEDIVYLGDTARVPYGTRSKETVIKFSLEDANFLLSKKVKCIVIACNTASALAGKELKKKVKIPVLDIITPAVRYAKQISHLGKIGVIGTKGTIGSGVYKFNYAKACPLFVPFVEEGETKGIALKEIIHKYLGDIKDKKKKIDILVLGCTHYPLIQNQIRKEIGKDIKIVNPGIPLALELGNFLTKNNMRNNQDRIGKRSFFVTDHTKSFLSVAKALLGEKIELKLKKVNL